MTCGSAFIPVGNDGWLISEAAPQCMPTFELNEAIALKAGRHGLDFAQATWVRRQKSKPLAAWFSGNGRLEPCRVRSGVSIMGAKEPGGLRQGPAAE